MKSKKSYLKVKGVQIDFSTLLYTVLNNKPNGPKNSLTKKFPKFPLIEVFEVEK